MQSHRAAESRGKRWRWCVRSQEFIGVMPIKVAELNNPRLLELDRLEVLAVSDWLVKRRYADESVISAVLKVRPVNYE